jgi:hypothetical protein
LGTNGLVGAQNNIFLDTPTNSRTANTITRYGNVTQGTFSPYTKEAGKWSNYFDGYRSWLTIPLTSALTTSVGLKISANFYNVGNKGDMRWSSGILTASRYGVVSNSSNDGYSKGIFSIYDTTNVLYVFGVNTGIVISKNMWYSISVEFTSTTTANLTVNDATSVLTGLAFSAYLNYIVVGSNLYFDAGGYDEYFLHGYVSNVVISNSSGIILETCKDNRFKDNSIYNHTLTPTGNVKVSPFSSYSNSIGYDAMSYGGSGYFDGNGDYLQLPSSSNFDFGSGDFEIAFAVYLPSVTLSSTQCIVGRWGASPSTNAFIVRVEANGKIGFIYNDSNYLYSTNTLFASQFNTGILKRVGSTLSITLNDVVTVLSTSFSANLVASTNPITVGAYLNSAYLSGYISNLRITKAGTEVLNLKFNNAGIRDESGMNNIETVGDAKVSSDGQGVVFDGNGDYLQLNSSETFLGTAAFSVSFDFIISGSGDHDEQHILQSRNANYVDLLISYRRSNKTCYFGGMDGATSSVSAPITLQDGVQYSASLTRNSSGSVKFTVNGTDVFTCISTTNLQANYWQIGKRYTSDGANHFFNGTIKNLTITKGA